MNYDINLYQRPNSRISEQIIEIVNALTGTWFTEGVPDDTSRDLLFQDVLCLTKEDDIISFIIFTCWDGAINITLMGTHPEFQGAGYGSILLNHFFNYIIQLGFKEVVVMTVPPDTKSSYQGTLNFYLKNGFIINRRYTELWESGAIELKKNLSCKN